VTAPTKVRRVPKGIKKSSRVEVGDVDLMSVARVQLDLPVCSAIHSEHGHSVACTRAAGHDEGKTTAHLQDDAGRGRPGGLAVTRLGGTDVLIHREDVNETLPPHGLLGLDVETTWMSDRGQFDPDFRIRTIQVATEDEAWVYDLADEAEAEAEQIMPILTNPAYSFVSHTPMDVLSIERFLGVDLTGRNLDTRSLAIMADPDRTHDRDLKSLAAEHGMPELAAADAELYEWMRFGWIYEGGKKNAARSAVEEYGWNRLASMPGDEWPEVFTRYAGLDAIACRRLAPILLRATHAPAPLLKMERWLDTRANRITLRGARVDVARLEVQLAEAKEATSTAKAVGSEIAGVNIIGPKLHGYLEAHGVDWSRWEGPLTDTGKASITKESVKLLDAFDLDDEARTVVGHLSAYKAHYDMLTKTEGISKRLVIEDGIPRIHPELNPRGASTTARMSSAGPNMQNFSKKDPRQRGLFLPEPGHVLATIDFAQIELRVVAALAREDKMIDVIKSGGDLHQLTVDLLAELGVEITRDTGKMGNFLIVYGGGPKALSDQAGIPLDVATEVVRGMRAQYPAIAALKEYLGLRDDGIRTVSNRWLPVTRNKRTGELRSYATVNYAVQSAARELLVDAWFRFEEEFGRRGLVWWPIHDELVLQIPEDDVEAVLADAEKAMSWRDFRGEPIEGSAIVLRDEEGVSRWMPGDVAEKIAEAKAA
jgi:DNA polymerase-1